MLISLIIPVYNAAQYLRRCLDSVLAQDYSSLEIVLVDDGSTDDSPAICDEYAKMHSHISVWHITNGGASLARKKGIEVAKGEYFTFVDSDDYVAPGYVSTMHRLIEKYGTRISACGVKRVMLNEKLSADEVQSEDEKLLDFDELMPRFFKYEFWGFPGGLYHRSVFGGITFPQATLSEDYYVKAQIFCNERQIAVTSAPLYFYEYHSESLSHTKLSAKAFEEFENVRKVYEMIKNTPPSNIPTQIYKQSISMALSNVIETCVKLFSYIRDIREENEKLFALQFDEIRKFLKVHSTEVFFCSNLNRNVKCLSLCFALLPKCVCRQICKLL